jgi:predicted CXXCH cytochrome family protein
MPFVIACLLALFLASTARAEEKADSCVECHAALPDELGAPVEGMKRDVHAAHGLSCADCHGGDPSDPDLSSMEPEKGFRGTPARAEIPDFCARCHSDPAYMRKFDPSFPTNQRERFHTSVHGKRLAEGDEKVATCTSCHGVHGIRSGRQADSPVYPANIPATCGGCHSNSVHMAGYEIPTDQEAEYRRSVHGQLLLQRRDLSAPACNTCHDNHGASPPGVTSIAQVCGQCHVNNMDLFVASPHKPAFDALDLPECVVCHGDHGVQRISDEALGVEAGAICVRCHQSGSDGWTAAKQMRETIDELKGRMAIADALLTKAESAGMEVSDARYEFQEVASLLIQARTGAHRASAEYVEEVAAPGIELAGKTEKIALAALAEATARRRHLFFPLAVIAVTILLLALKLRSLERGGERARK